MKKTYKNVLVGLLSVGLFAGCASKNVEYDASAANAKNTTNQTQNTTSNDKLDSISGSETSFDNSYTPEATDNSGTMDTAQENSLNLNDGIYKVKSQIDGKTIVLSSVHFGFDKFNLTDKMRTIATTNASKIDNVASSYSNLKIKLEGNCDEWGTDEYNYALGLKRAKSTKDALVADGIDESRIMMVSFGESNPVCTDKTDACWKMNRRVDYKLLP